MIHDFLKDSSRLISPYLLQTGTRTKWNSHDAAAQYLIGKVAGQKDLFAVIMRSFEEEQEVLRVRGTVEELEEEWFYMNRAVETKYQPDSLSFLASDIYNRFLINDFEDRKSEYSAISSLKDRREFLKNSVSYSRFFYEFFKDSAYWSVEIVDTKLSQEYTQYLYNPYTGDYNVEVVVKRRFLEKIVETYWPYRLEVLRNVDSGTAFIEKYNETVQIIEMLLKFAHVKDAEAKRLERRVRRAKGVENIDEFLTEFLKNNSPQVNENKK